MHSWSNAPSPSPSPSRNPSPNPTTNNTVPLRGTLPVVEIISFLNQKARTSYRNTATTKALIKARFNEGFTKNDFFKVISHMVNEWLTHEKMQRFIRPATLFSNKFEGYLQEASKNESSGLEFTPDALQELERIRGTKEATPCS